MVLRWQIQILEAHQFDYIAKPYKNTKASLTINQILSNRERLNLKPEQNSMKSLKTKIKQKKSCLIICLLVKA